MRRVKMEKRKMYCVVKDGMGRREKLEKERYWFVMVNRKKGKSKEYGVGCVGGGE